MPDYQVNIALDNTTLGALENENYQMQVYKGVQAGLSDGALPTVWFTLDIFSSKVTVSWSVDYEGYFSDTPIAVPVTVDITTNQPMELGNVITLETDGSSEVTTTDGVSTAYSFLSNQETTWTCGLMTAANGGDPAPICAFPIHQTTGVVIEPYEKILILFTQTELDTGSVVQTAVSESISITLSPDTPKFDTSFDIDKGWDTNGSPQAVENPVNFDMAPDLIVPPAS